MIVTTGLTVPEGEIIETIGIVRGEYTKLMAEAREQAYDRMVTHAQSVGADAVIGVNFTTSMITQGAAEILAYGTAVKLKR